MKNYYHRGQMIALTAFLVIASPTTCWGQDNLNVSVDCGNSTLTVSGYFSTNNHGMNILLFKDNAIVSVATDEAGPSINRTFGLSGSGSYYARAMEVNNDAHNINSASVAVSCSSNQPSQPSSPTPAPSSGGSGSLNFQIVSYDCNSGTLQYQLTSGDGSPINVTLPGIFGGTINPNSVASYTFPGDARTGRTVTGTASQGGNQINISFTTSCNLTSGQQSGGSAPSTPTNPNYPSAGGNCNFSEGQFLFTFYEERIYAHYYNGVLFAAYQDGSGFKPQHWMQAASGAAGLDQAKVSCFSEQDPRLSGGGSNSPSTNNPPTTNPPSGNSQAGGNLTGNFDGASCNVISGWVLNRNTPNQSAKVDIYVNGWLVARNAITGISRQDVANAYGIGGYNAFGFKAYLPFNYKVGVPLTISVKYAGTSTDIPGSPKTTVSCNNDYHIAEVDPDCYTQVARFFPASEQSVSMAGARTGVSSLQLSAKGAGAIASLTSRLIPVSKDNDYALDVYAFTPALNKRNLTPQIATAAIGGIVAGLALTHSSALPDQRNAVQTVPILGFSTALLIPLIKSLLTNRLPKASVALAFYNNKGTFMYQQEISIDKTAREDWQRLHIQGQAHQDGYLVVRLQNRSKAPVYFDDIRFDSKHNSEYISSNSPTLEPQTSSSPTNFVAQVSTDGTSVYLGSGQGDCGGGVGGAIVENGINIIDPGVNVTAPAPIYRYENGTVIEGGVNTPNPLPGADVTDAFNQQLRETKQHFCDLASWVKAQYGGTTPNWNGTGDPHSGEIATLLRDFINDVKTNAPYDLKNNGFGEGVIGPYSHYNNAIFRFDDYGNINFGLAAAACGIPLSIALCGAGVNQWQSETGEINWSNLGGCLDDSQDSLMIKLGYSLFNGCNNDLNNLIGNN